MDKLRHKEYDFGSKLRQASVIERLKDYIAWQRSQEGSSSKHPLPPYAPVSINLDLTSSCNFACPHCVDSAIINTGKHLGLETIQQTVALNRRIRPDRVHITLFQPYPGTALFHLCEEKGLLEPGAVGDYYGEATMVKNPMLPKSVLYEYLRNFVSLVYGTE